MEKEEAPHEEQQLNFGKRGRDQRLTRGTLKMTTPL